MDKLSPKRPEGSKRVSTFEDPNWHARPEDRPWCQWAAPIKPLEPWQYGK